MTLFNYKNKSIQAYITGPYTEPPCPPYANANTFIPTLTGKVFNFMHIMSYSNSGIGKLSLLLLYLPAKYFVK